MALEEKDGAHLLRLINEGGPLAHWSQSHRADEASRAKCVGWLAQAAQFVRTFVPDGENIYRKSVDKLAFSPGFEIWKNVRETASLLSRLGNDLASGYVGSQADRASADTFDDLLDHAQAYLEDGKREPAAVLAGVVFEDSARRVFRKVTGKSDKGTPLEQVINALKAAPIDAPTITNAASKRAKAAAGIRTSSTHAQWDEFSAEDVLATITFSREFIAKHLA